jgi:SRSO17 transposase
MEAQRFFIEHSFKEQEQIVGMDQFQTRKWLSCYHQVALIMLAGSFLHSPPGLIAFSISELLQQRLRI